jgi:hypothetical protein
MCHQLVTRTILTCALILIQAICHSQSRCGTAGCQNGGYGNGGDDSTSTIENFFHWFITVVRPADPNDITGLSGFQERKWVSINDKLSYKVRFENDPKFATAPAQNVYIHVPVDSNININTLSLSDFGFGRFTFKVPENSPFYTTRLDVRDSLGLYVDIAAGIDITKHELFWIFRSIDPATGLPPTGATVGFLPVNDTLARQDSIPGQGEGFVSFAIRSKATVKTGDSVLAKAIIRFDDYEEIATNTWNNTIDALSPISKINGHQVAGDTIHVRWSGADDPRGTGIKQYDLYVSEDSAKFFVYKKNVKDTSASFEGMPGHQYRFFTRAADNVGNLERLKDSAEITVSLESCKTEVCNGKDDDCDGLVDEGFPVTAYYRDNDGDGFGNAQDSVSASPCRIPDGFTIMAGDCNDNDSTLYPGSNGNGCDICPTEAVTFAARFNNATNYQWQVDAGLGFQNITEGGKYTGTTSKYLTLTQPLTSWYGYKYRCVISSGNQTNTSPEYTLKFAFSWKGLLSDAWENPLNWSCNQVPDEFTDVIINSTKPVKLNSNTAIRSITLYPQSHLTIAPGKVLEVKNK